MMNRERLRALTCAERGTVAAPAPWAIYRARLRWRKIMGRLSPLTFRREWSKGRCKTLALRRGFLLSGLPDGGPFD